jgi:hypothetical protein
MRSPARDKSECSKGPTSFGEPATEEKHSALSSVWRWFTDRTGSGPRPSTEPLPAASGDDIAERPDFIEKRRRLEALAKEFGCEPGMVTLSPKKRIFEYLGQSFTAEGEAWPDGRVEIYFDPNMGDARMGCCLAHELQHLRYFEVLAAYHAERDDGPLHRRFASFTPELLAAQRGVSDYSNEHWDAWKGKSAPKLFSMELEEGHAEPINETIAEVAKAQYNWGPDVWINPVWKELQKAINEEYEKLRM